jgi:hypothetical protein
VYAGKILLSIRKNNYIEVRAVSKSVNLLRNSCLLIILAAITCGVSSCGNTAANSEAKITTPNEKAVASILPCQTKELEKSKHADSTSKISLVIDGSMSMLGYVTTPNSRYSQTLNLLDSIVGKKEGTDYFRIEAERKQIERPGVKAQQAGFYTGTSSLIAKAFEQNSKAGKSGKGDKASKEDPNQLIAVVTDLQPDSGDVNLIGQHVDRYLKKDGYAVAIWGIKSEFEGTVYPPNNAPAFNYSTKGKGIDKGRPFYILIAGPEAAINDLVTQVKNNGGSLFDKNSELTVFSPSHSMDKVTYANKLKEAPTGFTMPETLNAGGKTIDGEGQPVQLLELNDRTEAQKIEFNFDSNIKSDVLSTLKLNSAMTLSSYDTEQQKFVETKDQSAFKLESKNSGDRMSLSLNIKPEDLKKGTYYINADLQAADVVNAPKNWAKWDDATAKDGSKTQDLNNFIRNINISMSDITKGQNMTVARLCLAIQRN